MKSFERISEDPEEERIDKLLQQNPDATIEDFLSETTCKESAALDKTTAAKLQAEKEKLENQLLQVQDAIELIKRRYWKPNNVTDEKIKRWRKEQAGYERQVDQLTQQIRKIDNVL